MLIDGPSKDSDQLCRQLNMWHTCDTVVLRWRTTVAPNATEDVTGIVALETVYANDSFLIDTVYSEFNSAAWLVDIGTWICSRTYFAC